MPLCERNVAMLVRSELPVTAAPTVNIGIRPIVTTQYAAIAQKNSHASDSTTLSVNATDGGRIRLPNG